MLEDDSLIPFIKVCIWTWKLSGLWLKPRSALHSLTCFLYLNVFGNLLHQQQCTLGLCLIFRLNNMQMELWWARKLIASVSAVSSGLGKPSATVREDTCDTSPWLMMMIVRSHQLTTDIIEALLELGVGKALADKDNVLLATFYLQCIYSALQCKNWVKWFFFESLWLLTLDFLFAEDEKSEWQSVVLKYNNIPADARVSAHGVSLRMKSLIC